MQYNASWRWAFSPRLFFSNETHYISWKWLKRTVRWQRQKGENCRQKSAEAACTQAWVLVPPCKLSPITKLDLVVLIRHLSQRTRPHNGEQEMLVIIPVQSDRHPSHLGTRAHINFLLQLMKGREDTGRIWAPWFRGNTTAVFSLPPASKATAWEVINGASYAARCRSADSLSCRRFRTLFISAQGVFHGTTKFLKTKYLQKINLNKKSN